MAVGLTPLPAIVVLRHNVHAVHASPFSASRDCPLLLVSASSLASPLVSPRQATASEGKEVLIQSGRSRADAAGGVLAKYYSDVTQQVVGVAVSLRHPGRIICRPCGQHLSAARGGVG